MSPTWVCTAGTVKQLADNFYTFTVTMESANRAGRRFLVAYEAAKEQRRCDVFQRCLERDAAERRARWARWLRVR